MYLENGQPRSLQRRHLPGCFGIAHFIGAFRLENMLQEPEEGPEAEETAVCGQLVTLVGLGGI